MTRTQRVFSRPKLRARIHSGKIEATLSPDSRLEATVKPDQIQANVKPDQVTAKVEGQADVRVTVAVEGNGQVTGLSATSSGNVRASAGFRAGAVRMPQAASPPGGA